MLIVFNDIRRLVHFEFVPHSITVHAKFYVEVLKRLKRRVYRVQPDIADNWKLHTDIVSVHTAFLVIRFLTESKVQRPPPPSPYCPGVTVTAPENSHERTSFRVSWQSQRGLHQGFKVHSGKGLP